MSDDRTDTTMTYRCISGSPVGNDGVCVEHGETACVIGFPVPSAQVRPSKYSAAPAREQSESMASRRRA